MHNTDFGFAFKQRLLFIIIAITCLAFVMEECNAVRSNKVGLPRDSVLSSGYGSPGIRGSASLSGTGGRRNLISTKRKTNKKISSTTIAPMTSTVKQDSGQLETEI